MSNRSSPYLHRGMTALPGFVPHPRWGTGAGVSPHQGATRADPRARANAPARQPPSLSISSLNARRSVSRSASGSQLAICGNTVRQYRVSRSVHGGPLTAARAASSTAVSFRRTSAASGKADRRRRTKQMIAVAEEARLVHGRLMQDGMSGPPGRG